MKIFFRADASSDIGTGHVIRCLTLADKLAEQKAQICFICKELPGNLCDFIESKKYKVFRLPQSHFAKDEWKGDAVQVKEIIKKSGGCDCVVVDHYAIDEKWERHIRDVARSIVVIDDLANRRHDCDMLLDQNYCQGYKLRYTNLVPSHCLKMLGPVFALLRPEFVKARRRVKARNGQIKNILISFGGVDPSNETCKALRAIALLKRPAIKVDVMIGINNLQIPQIKKLAAAMPQVSCNLNVKNISQFMSEADLCIGAAGCSTWECFCLGLPILAITTSEHQIGLIKYLSKHKVLHFIGRNVQITAKDICATLKYFFKNPILLSGYSKVSFDLVDGLGAGRCADIMARKLNKA